MPGWTRVFAGKRGVEAMSGLLEIHNLTVTYHFQGRRVPAVRALDLTVGEGEKLAIVGESGAGKSTLAGAIMGLLPGPAEIEGEIVFRGLEISPRTLAELRGKEIVLIPQNVYNSINPVLSIGNQKGWWRRGASRIF